ncbi:hypothetical protein RKD44_003787 [Streptomyces collinus]
MGLQGLDVHARRHDVLRGQLAQVQGAHEQLGRVRLQGALGGRVLGEGDQLLGAAGGGQLLGRFQAEAAHEAVRRVVQVPDEGAEGGGEAALRARDDLRDGQRAGDRPVLGDQLADDHQDDGGEDHAEQGRDRRGGAAQADRPQRAAQQHREGRLGQHADDQRGHRDAELGAGQLEGQGPYGLQGAVGTALTGLGGTLQVGALDGGEGELGRDEEGAGQGEEEGQQEEQDLGHRATPLPSRAYGGTGGPAVARPVLGGSITERDSLTGSVDAGTSRAPEGSPSW